MKTFFKTLKMLSAFLFYRNYKTEENILYMLAEEKGMMCTGLRNGIAQFDPNYPPQTKPEILSFKEFKTRWVKNQEVQK